MAKICRFIIISLIAILLIPSASSVAQDGTRCTEDESISYLWQVQDEDCVFHQEISFTINVAYPTEVTNYNFARQTVEDYFNERRTEFWSFANDMDFTFGFLAPWSLDISYTTYHYSDTVLSLQFSESVYTGGAHPNLLFRTFTFDLANETVLSLDDLFPPENQPFATLQPLVQAALESQFIERVGTISDFDTDWIREGTGEDPYNYRNFALTEDALVLFFEPYQVAPYAAGPFTVEISLSDLSAILADDILISQ